MDRGRETGSFRGPEVHLVPPPSTRGGASEWAGGERPAGAWGRSRLRKVLARLSLAGNPVAVLYGFITRKKFDFYQSGVRRENTGPLRSPGNLAHLLLMQALTERGVTEYDFLRGSSTYKQRLATRENQLVGIRIWRPTLRAAIHRSCQLAARAFGKGQRLMRRS